jgi:hypothetical protein
MDLYSAHRQPHGLAGPCPSPEGLLVVGILFFLSVEFMFLSTLHEAPLGRRGAATNLCTNRRNSS